MKKWLAVFLALALFLASAAQAEDGQEASMAPAGDWHAGLNGIPVRLTLNADGTFEFIVPAVLSGSFRGVWIRNGVFVTLEGSGTLILASADLLIWMGNDLVFTRKPQKSYVPADLLPDAPPEMLNGYWKCAYADADGAAVPAAALNETTDLFIDNTTAALGGPRFGDVFQKFTRENGALITADFRGQGITMALQTDGFLRVSITSEGGGTVLYLAHMNSEPRRAREETFLERK